MLQAVRYVMALGVLMCLTGCLAVPVTAMVGTGMAAAQAGATSYSRGEMQIAGRANIDEVWFAIQRTSDVLALPVTRTKRTKLMHTVWLQSANGGSIRISVYKRSERITGIKLRVGFWGNLAMSRVIAGTILEEITKLRVEQHLGPYEPADSSPVVPFLD